MSDETPKIVSKTQARQGVTPHMARYVLTYGIGGVVVLFAIIYLLFFRG